MASSRRPEELRDAAFYELSQTQRRLLSLARSGIPVPHDMQEDLDSAKRRFEEAERRLMRSRHRAALRDRLGALIGWR